MNALEEQALVEGLRRRGDHRVAAAGLSCTVPQYRAAARKVGRGHGWKIRTYALTNEAGNTVGALVYWADRGYTDLEMRAAMIVIASMGSGVPRRGYDEVLEDLRRQNLRPVEDT